MKRHTLKLYVAQGSQETSDLDFFAQAFRDQNRLSFEYTLQGVGLSQLLIPSFQEQPRRKDELWLHTCFEAFIASAHSPEYWELNFSPSGDWNCYHFQSYRSGQKNESRVGLISSVLDQARFPHQIRFRAEVDVSHVPALLKAPLQLSMTGVLETLDQRKGYWAVHHAGQKPDFHLRESFVLDLESSRD